MKQIKRWGTFLLALAMVFALAGCGGAENNGENASVDAGNVMESIDVENSSENVDVEDDGADADNVMESADAESSSENVDDGDVEAATENNASKTDTTSATDATSKILVVYFSRTGEQYTVGEIEKGNTEIVAEMIADETGADLFQILPEDDYYPYTYDDLTNVAKQEQSSHARPAYQRPIPDLSQYDTIFIGSPVWWGDWPMIMYTFFETEDLSGKTLIPFSTNEGSGLSGFDDKLAAACPDATVRDGLAVRGYDAQNDKNNVRSAVNSWIAGLGL